MQVLSEEQMEQQEQRDDAELHSQKSKLEAL
jgi:hypothetical protein